MPDELHEMAERYQRMRERRREEGRDGTRGGFRRGGRGGGGRFGGRGGRDRGDADFHSFSNGIAIFFFKNSTLEIEINLLSLCNRVATCQGNVRENQMYQIFSRSGKSQGI